MVIFLFFNQVSNISYTLSFFKSPLINRNIQTHVLTELFNRQNPCPRSASCYSFSFLLALPCPLTFPFPSPQDSVSPTVWGFSISPCPEFFLSSSPSMADDTRLVSDTSFHADVVMAANGSHNQKHIEFISEGSFWKHNIFMAESQSPTMGMMGRILEQWGPSHPNKGSQTLVHGPGLGRLQNSISEGDFEKYGSWSPVPRILYDAYACTFVSTLPENSDVQSGLSTITPQGSMHRARPNQVHGVCSELLKLPWTAQRDLPSRSLESVWEME